MDEDKMKDLSLDISYDEDVDILYVSFGKPKAAISMELKSGAFVRLDPFTDEIVGVTILDFKERYMKSNPADISDCAKSVVPLILKDFNA